MHTRKRGQVKFNFLPSNDKTELRLHKGQEVLILEEDSVNGWARGVVIQPNSALDKALKESNVSALSELIVEEKRRGRVGLFPGSHIRIMQVLEDDELGDDVVDDGFESDKQHRNPSQHEASTTRAIIGGFKLPAIFNRPVESPSPKSESKINDKSSQITETATQGLAPPTQGRLRSASTGDRPQTYLISKFLAGSNQKESESVSKAATNRPSPPRLNTSNGGHQEQQQQQQEQQQQQQQQPPPMSKSIAGRTLTRTSGIQGLHKEKSLVTLTKSFKFRVKIMRELLDTEKSYIAMLEMIVEEYMRPLQELVKSAKSGITPRIIPRIFSNVELLLNLQKTLLKELSERIDSSTFGGDTCMGDVFLKLTPYLRSYTQYVNNYPEAIAMLTCASHNKRLSEFLQKRTSGKIGGEYFLSDLLITPIQRLPRYQMLLTDLLKHTLPEHEDHQNLTLAVQKVTEVAQQINARKGEFENMSKIWTIQSKFTSWGLMKEEVVLVKPSRRFQKEGQATVNGKDRILYLFNDSLLIANIKMGDKRSVYRHLSLFGATLADLSRTNNTEYGFSFRVAQQSITIETQNEKENDEWMIDIQTAIKTHTQNKLKLKQAENLPLHELCKFGKLDKLEEYFELNNSTGKIDINAKDSKGRTALMISAKRGDLPSVKYLVDVARADPSLKNNDGLNALEIATSADHSAVVDFLSKYDEDRPLVKSVDAIKKGTSIVKDWLSKPTRERGSTVGSRLTNNNVSEQSVLKEISRLEQKAEELKKALNEVEAEKAQWQSKLQEIRGSNNSNPASSTTTQQSNPPPPKTPQQGLNNSVTNNTSNSHSNNATPQNNATLTSLPAIKPPDINMRVAKALFEEENDLMI